MSSLIFDTFKILLTALVILAVAQLSQRDTLLAAVLASIPLVSVLAMMWMNQDGATSEEIIMFSRDIVWLVLPSLLLFIVMPELIERGWNFYPALGGGLCATVIGYFLMIELMKRFQSIS
ncbi:MAG TPA: DUF3147 family protein [Candidatus Thalassarchaeaceae archaeon]|jgi:hypothetical protein|nr:DUF3147 family protein [Euryarchaeota archaeon]DAC63931.1 MAG TPA: DUF3147 family protein [Candidatus Poseidoniales archaeon]HII12403.1 DUF3147 family protein [Candidatus Thalassarchaeaceae archaeon]|tara:strand:- start:1149 stop:1508 length:360 start_codon:yes stop_codon:yes gene_type:complete